MHLHCPIKGIYTVRAIAFALKLCYKLPVILQKTTKDLKAHISLKNMLYFLKKYFFWLKPYILFPNLAPALLNERSDGDYPGRETDSVRSGRLLLFNGI